MTMLEANLQSWGGRRKAWTQGWTLTVLLVSGLGGERQGRGRFAVAA